jgi:NitT/TauT family transport system ATP-binding protein
VKDTIVFALITSRRLSRREADERAASFIEKVNLTKFSKSYPHTLSGGMKQRAAIARAMAVEPEVLLMDEPFGALDALTRAKMQDELLQLCLDSKFTVLFVTHSIPEAIRLGTRILLLTAQPGRVKAEVDTRDTDAARIHELLFGGELEGGSIHV